MKSWGLESLVQFGQEITTANLLALSRTCIVFCALRKNSESMSVFHMITLLMKGLRSYKQVHQLVIQLLSVLISLSFNSE